MGLMKLRVTLPSSARSPSSSSFRPAPRSSSSSPRPPPPPPAPPPASSSPPGVLHLVILESNRRSTRTSAPNLRNHAVRPPIFARVIHVVHQVRGHAEDFVRGVLWYQVARLYTEIQRLLDVSLHFLYPCIPSKRYIRSNSKSTI